MIQVRESFRSLRRHPRLAGYFAGHHGWRMCSGHRAFRMREKHAGAGVVRFDSPCHSRPGDGQVQVAGLDTLPSSIPEIAQRVGMVFQRPASQLFHLRVEDEVAFGPRNLGLAEREVQKRTEWALQATGLVDLRNERPSALSGGQKQCLAIAAALAMRTQVLVLDEPTASLDVPNTHRVIDTLATLRAEYGITIVLIEHRLAEAAQLAERVILMEDGHILADGAPQEVFADRELRQRLGLRRPTEEPSDLLGNVDPIDGHPPARTSHC